ncbi:hypothetical protein CVM52_19525 [Pseudooceanicola lipolyticus]|uniref:Uncharacterized protein n=1 Tax=Pseudooceanicola lipolyticus TaxID=2029104 RepID=A0A2M8IWU9_9RHOB|nr:hypothetical protein [Pseudooceanicola lipolyticus]PJE34984.1 hypothetical protein CVM52_19525 [Pseudooceanicola lipolyticus]
MQNDADRQDMTESTEDEAPTPGQQGRAGGNLERKVGTRDLLKRARQDRAGVTRVRKSDEKTK